MSDDDQSYDIAGIRQLLLKAFTAKALHRFCRDRLAFKPVLTGFGDPLVLDDMVDTVIDFCETRDLWDDLLAAIAEVNPRRYQEFASRIGAPALPPAPQAVGPARATRASAWWHRWYWIAGGLLLVLLLGWVAVRWMTDWFSPALTPGAPLPTSSGPTATNTPQSQRTEPTDTATPTPTSEPTPAIAVTRQALYEDPANHCLWSPQGDWLAVAGYHLRVYDAQTLEEEYVLDSMQWPEAIAFSPDGTLLAVADDSVTLLEAGSWGQVRPLAGSKGTGSIAFSPDGRRLATATGGTVKFWEVETGNELRTLPGGSGRAVVFSSKGELVAAAGGVAGQDILLWEADTYTELATLKGHSNWINSLAVAPGRGWLASGSTDGTVRLWDLAEMRQVGLLTGHEDQVEDVAFSPDGRLLASASWDLTVRLWEVATGRDVATLTGHTAWIKCVCFSPDGTMLGSGSGDQFLVWHLVVEP